MGLYCVRDGCKGVDGLTYGTPSYRMAPGKAERTHQHHSKGDSVSNWVAPNSSLRIFLGFCAFCPADSTESYLKDKR